MKREEGFVGQRLLALTDPLPAHQGALGEMPHSTWASEHLPDSVRARFPEEVTIELGLEREVSGSRQMWLVE